MSETVGILRGANNNNDNFYATIETNTRLRIGRHVENDLVIGLNIISLYHCEIIAKTDALSDVTIVYLTDLSANGTYLNGSLIGRDRTVVLLSGSIISFASGHLNMMYIEKRNNLQFEEDVEVTFVSDQEIRDNRKEIKNTSKVIGYGGQAEVFLAYDQHRSTHQLACKRIQLSRCHSKASLKRETDILKHNKHINVLSLVTLFQTENKVYSFMPLYTGGTLRERLNKRMNEKNATFIFKQILSGLQYIHDNNIIHCDVKAENVLLSNLKERPRVIISDFGLSKYKTETKQPWPDNYGTFRDHSPEILKNEWIDEKVDCWAAGLMYYYMLFGMHPFIKSTTATNNDIQHAILNDVPDYCMDLNISLSAQHILSKLLEKDPCQRYSCAQCLASHWIQWSTQLDEIQVRKEYQYERYLWFQDEPNPYEHVETEITGTLFVEDVREARNTKGPTPMMIYKRGVKLDGDDNGDFLEDIKNAKYPKQSLANFKKK